MRFRRPCQQHVPRVTAVTLFKERLNLFGYAFLECDINCELIYKCVLCTFTCTMYSAFKRVRKLALCRCQRRRRKRRRRRRIHDIHVMVKLITEIRYELLVVCPTFSSWRYVHDKLRFESLSTFKH